MLTNTAFPRPKNGVLKFKNNSAFTIQFFRPKSLIDFNIIIFTLMRQAQKMYYTPRYFLRATISPSRKGRITFSIRSSVATRLLNACMAALSTS